MVRLGALALVAWVLCATSSNACSIPVFRYALERWAPAPYELTVFHQGALSKAQQAVLALAAPKDDSDQDQRINVRVRTVDLDANPPAEMLDLWRQQKGLSVPAMVLRNPRGSAVEQPIWSGPLSEAAMRRVLDSPARAQIAQRLLKGESAVWVFLESGNKAQDDAAVQLLAARLAHLQKTLQLPVIEPDDIVKHSISAAADELKVAFSVVRLARNNPEEEVFVRMLTATEDDLDETQEPMTFPVFGRGRALFALVGRGITHETIDEACSFVIGPCSCVVKELNPGQDLLLTANWGSVEQTAVPQEELPTTKPGTLVPIAPGLPEAEQSTTLVVQTPLLPSPTLMALVALAAGLGCALLIFASRRQG